MPTMEDDETIFKAHAAASRALQKERNATVKTVLVCDCIRDDGKPDKSCRSYVQCCAAQARSLNNG